MMTGSGDRDALATWMEMGLKNIISQLGISFKCILEALENNIE
jgi:hypothetical protein